MKSIIIAIVLIKIVSSLPQGREFICPTEKSQSKSKFQEIEGKCYNFNTEDIWDYEDYEYDTRIFSESETYCKTAFGNNVEGKLFEPATLHVNNAVYNAANETFGLKTWWTGVVYDNGILKYVSNGLPVTVNPIPWYDLRHKSSNFRWCISFWKSSKWYLDICNSTDYNGGTICEAIF